MKGYRQKFQSFEAVVEKCHSRKIPKWRFNQHDIQEYLSTFLHDDWGHVLDDPYSQTSVG